MFFGDFKFANLKSEEAKTLCRVANRQISKHKKVIKTLRNGQQRLLKIKRLTVLFSKQKLPTVTL
jgi:hypothetical protein